MENEIVLFALGSYTGGLVITIFLTETRIKSPLLPILLLGGWTVAIMLIGYELF